MDESKERAVVAFTTVFAHSEHWRGAYVPLAAEQARIAADNVACATIGVPPGLLLATVREMASPPYLCEQRDAWIASAALSLTAVLGA